MNLIDKVHSYHGNISKEELEGAMDAESVRLVKLDKRVGLNTKQKSNNQATS